MELGGGRLCEWSLFAGGAGLFGGLLALWGRVLRLLEAWFQFRWFWLDLDSGGHFDGHRYYRLFCHVAAVEILADLF